MAKQTLTFLLLPNGVTANKTLRLSIYLTPRLEDGATLGIFPDMLNWTGLVASHGLQFEIACDTRTAVVSADRSVLRPDVWSAIFAASNFVEKFKIPDYDKRLIVSYPVRPSLAYLKYAYQSLGTNSFTAQQRGFRTLLQDLIFRDGRKSTLDSELAAIRLTMWNEQQGNNLFKVRSTTVAVPPQTASMPPDGVATTLSPPTATRDTVTRFALFHRIPPAPNRPPLPKTEADFEKLKTLDFHRAVSALNSYPSLLRQLGLVFDVEVPASLCPESPQASAYRSIAIRKVTAGFKWSVAPKFFLPPTAYYRDKDSYTTAPATPAAQIASKNYAPGDVIGGLLVLEPGSFNLAEVDLDGALLNALLLADNLANVSNESMVEEILPALRSGGISLMANGRAMQLLQSIRNNLDFDTALQSNTLPANPFNALDLVRGYRIDIWSSQTKQWYSLHRRNARYGFGPAGNITVAVHDEEGFTQLTPAQAADDPTRKPDKFSIDNGLPQPATDLFLHERILRWQGWSLSVQRPGLPLNRSANPQMAATPDPTLGKPMTPFKMTTAFSATAGSLPKLRFGFGYRMRVRAVDLAGNSVPLNAPSMPLQSLPANGAQFPYLRFEPVLQPLVVLRRMPGPGGSLEWMVIRSHNADESLDSIYTSEFDDRHIAPPPIAVRMAEHHGMFDDAQDKLRGDQAIYDLIRARDEYEFRKENGFPLENVAQLPVGYLPDPIARGAALRDLPGTPNNTNGRLASGELEYATLPDVQPRPGSVTYIDFGTNWPARNAFRLVIAEGLAPPAWDAANRVLTVYLPKAAVIQIPLSSYLDPADLNLMGVWAWMRENFEAQDLAAMQSAVAAEQLTFVNDLIALLTRLVLEGGHEMITPSRTLTLVHAVQQPLRRPIFLQLPVIHQPGAPMLASSLRNLFTPITAWRSHGSHDTVLLGGLEIHGQSSAQIDLEARWLEVTDDPLQPAPLRSWSRDHVETIHLKSLDGGEIAADATNSRKVAVYIPATDTLWLAAPFDELGGVQTPTDVAAPLHHFSDTKHRWVFYEAVATSRFREYFDETGLVFTRGSDPLLVDIPSSARPTVPEIHYVVPIFGWERQERSNTKTSIRFGNALRVYLNRPWYSSGLDELLGVVLWPAGSAAPDYLTREQNKRYLTQWGNDPIWQSGTLNPVPSVFDFPEASAIASSLTLEETTQPFDVAGHQVAFDQERGLWYCDIAIAAQSVYGAFVRLALARYQPHSIQGIELSKVVLADFAQLTPDRSAFLSIDQSDSRRARLAIGGTAPQGPRQSAIEVTIEQRKANIQSDLAWEPAASDVVTITEDSPAPSEPNAVLWSGKILFAKTPAAGVFRVKISEFELLTGDLSFILKIPVPRLVYAAVLGYDFPSEQVK